MILAEGAARAKTRLRAAKIAAGFDPTLEIGVTIVPHAVNFFQAGRDYQAVRKYVAEHQPFVVIDTLSLNSIGADENSAVDVTRTMSNIRALNAPGTIILHHLDKLNRGERGSSAIRANSDALLMLLDTDDILTLSCEKMRDDAAFEPLRLKLFEVPGSRQGDDERDACSVRLASQCHPSGALSPIQRQVLDAILGAFTTDSDGAKRPEWHTLVPTIKERSFYHAVERLRELGFVAEHRGRFAPTGKVT
jgi:hypothetical protein